ncbi:MAG: putative zinc-binding metallopeptidase [Planctomycetia bacterium]|nr:putative zinc-binding metallopeptidase [Planctomycetia bacterium]
MRARASRRREPRWARLPDRELLDWRLCDLGLEIEGSVLDERVERINVELARRGLRFRPAYWLSEEWFTPDGVPGVAIPFYLAHPRLMKLEQRQMLEVEGGTRQWCLRILRHEVGHAVDNAYRLHRRHRWRHLFGRSSVPYPEFYSPKPYSKRFVLHLDSWYAQSHPSEDFAETFAVWLRPGSRWRMQYAGWPALKKLRYVDELMHEIAGQPPLVRSRQRVDSLAQLKKTLREHYEEKRARYSTEHAAVYDRDLRRLFSEAVEHEGYPPAASVLRRLRPELREAVAHWTGAHQYTIDQVLQEMISRCRELKLRAHRSDRQTKRDAMILLTVHTMNYLHAGHHRLAL